MGRIRLISLGVAFPHRRILFGLDIRVMAEENLAMIRYVAD